jgi:hypothetical protein
LSNKDWSYGQHTTIASTHPLSKVSLLGAGSSTHGNSMGERTIFLEVTCAGHTCTITAPPHAHACPPVWFQMFGPTHSGVPSTAVWVRIGGNPASVGNWPNSPSTVVSIFRKYTLGSRQDEKTVFVYSLSIPTVSIIWVWLA